MTNYIQPIWVPIIWLGSRLEAGTADCPWMAKEPEKEEEPLNANAQEAQEKDAQSLS